MGTKHDAHACTAPFVDSLEAGGTFVSSLRFVATIIFFVSECNR